MPSIGQLARPLLAAIPGAVVIALTRNAGPLLAPLVAIPIFVGATLLLRAVPAEIWDVLRMRRAEPR